MRPASIGFLKTSSIAIACLFPCQTACFDKRDDPRVMATYREDGAIWFPGHRVQVARRTWCSCSVPTLSLRHWTPHHPPTYVDVSSPPRKPRYSSNLDIAQHQALLLFPMPGSAAPETALMDHEQAGQS